MSRCWNTTHNAGTSWHSSRRGIRRYSSCTSPRNVNMPIWPLAFWTLPLLCHTDKELRNLVSHVELNIYILQASSRDPGNSLCIQQLLIIFNSHHGVVYTVHKLFEKIHWRPALQTWWIIGFSISAHLCRRLTNVLSCSEDCFAGGETDSSKPLACATEKH